MSPVHLHLILNHVPVVGTVMGLCLLAYAVLRRDDRLVRVCLGMFAVLAAVALATFLTGEPAEEAVEGLAGVSESMVEQHEEAALLATVTLGFLGLLSLAVLLRFRTGALPRQAALLLLAAALVPAGMMAWTANLGGQIRHSEIRAEVVAAPPALAGEGDDHADQGTR
jgi:uncharacterized membrane protein